ncbi:MAG: hypothetical protein IKU90_01025 [Clostridia bacterium]|nr:hypothetical protein [Clostridia bacterium]
MNSTKRVLTLLLTVAMIVSACTVILSGLVTATAEDNIQSDDPITINAFQDGMAAYVVSGDYGIHLSLGAPFKGGRVCLVTMANPDSEVTIGLYKWEGDYNSTVAEDPIATTRVAPIIDCAYSEFDFGEQPAGDYFIRLYETKGIVGLMQSPQKVSNSYSYTGGLESQVDWWMQIDFTKTPVTPFLPTQNQEAAIDGNHTAPEEWVPGEDHILNTHKVMPDTWVFTDGLGRVSYTYEDVGGPKYKTVAMFYWDWHTSGNTPVNLTEHMKKYPEAKNDYDHPSWPTTGSPVYYWNEPIYGYYRTDDPWVVRKQAELLANAGVDTIFTDNTNGNFIWKESYDVILKTWDIAQTEGAVNTPKFSYMLPFGPSPANYEQLTTIYRDVYRKGRYQNLWFYWQGKPMIMAYNDQVLDKDTNMNKELANFFTYRAPFVGGDENTVGYRQTGMWGWLAIYPQTSFPGTRDHVKKRTIEQITVGIAVNHGTAMNGENPQGRSYTSTYTDRYEKEGDEASKWGYFFAEQFDYALTKDPEVIFITGWNEWVAERQQIWCGVENAFADQFIDEFSRDIEPSKGALQDHYYYQMVNYVRKFKGVNPIPTPSANATIDMNAGAEQWATVEPYYAAYIGNTFDRDADGKGIHYTETSGRNDIIGAQIARDDDYVYFLVECNENITPYTDSLWMNLYIDSDQQNQGWNTFEYVVNKSAASENTLVLEKFTAENDYSKTEKVADVEYKVDGKYMTVKIAKSDLGLSGNDYTINFAWTDNVHDEGDYSKFSGDILDFYISGDVAPGGRFKFSYISTTENSGAVVEETTEADTTGEETTAEDTDEVTDAATAEVTTEAPATETEEPAGGCNSVMGVASLLVAIAAAVALAKRKEN